MCYLATLCILCKSGRVFQEECRNIPIPILKQLHWSWLSWTKFISDKLLSRPLSIEKSFWIFHVFVSTQMFPIFDWNKVIWKHSSYQIKMKVGSNEKHIPTTLNCFNNRIYQVFHRLLEPKQFIHFCWS